MRHSDLTIKEEMTMTWKWKRRLGPIVAGILSLAVAGYSIAESQARPREASIADYSAAEVVVASLQDDAVTALPLAAAAVVGGLVAALASELAHHHGDLSAGEGLGSTAHGDMIFDE
jgi:NADH:ubiquinone oxidoreductase subunit 6 (subunit J)